jgi:hypothetical protein
MLAYSKNVLVVAEVLVLTHNDYYYLLLLIIYYYYDEVKLISEGGPRLY